MRGDRMFFGANTPKGDRLQLTVRGNIFRRRHILTRSRRVKATLEKTKEKERRKPERRDPDILKKGLGEISR